MPMKIPEMFRFSKVINHHSIPLRGNYWPQTQPPEEYFAKWVEWFSRCGIKTEIRTGDGTCSLWIEGKEEKRLRDAQKEGEDDNG